MLQVVPKREEINQSHGFLHKIKQQNEVKVFIQERLMTANDIAYKRPRCCKDLM